MPVVSLSCYVCTSFSIAIAKINKGTSEIHSISTSIDSRTVSTIGNTIEKITYSSAGYNAVLAVREICKKKEEEKGKDWLVLIVIIDMDNGESDEFQNRGISIEQDSMSAFRIQFPITSKFIAKLNLKTTIGHAINPYSMTPLSPFQRINTTS